MTECMTTPSAVKYNQMADQSYQMVFVYAYVTLVVIYVKHFVNRWANVVCANVSSYTFVMSYLQCSFIVSAP